MITISFDWDSRHEIKPKVIEEVKPKMYDRQNYLRHKQYYKQYYLEHKYEIKQKYIEKKKQSKVFKDMITNKDSMVLLTGFGVTPAETAQG